METDFKWLALVVLILVGGCSTTVFVSYNGEKSIAKHGMEQQTITYCDSYSTKTIWVKSK